MKVLLVNGSPRQHGCTERALIEVRDALSGLSDDTELIWLGTQVACCTNCRCCKGTDATRRCVEGGIVNKFLDMLPDTDAVVFGSPVYYGGLSGQMVNFLTRCFYSSPKSFVGKYVAGITSSRRAGGPSALASFNQFFLMHSMVVVGSQYWNEVHGDNPQELKYDVEGMQSMRRLAYNIHNAVCGTNVEFPEKHIHTNFISREFLKLQEEGK